MRDDAGCDRAALHGQDIAPPVRDARAVAPSLLSKSSAKRPRTPTRDAARPESAGSVADAEREQYDAGRSDGFLARRWDRQMKRS
jgi:hypothetical protein